MVSGEGAVVVEAVALQVGDGGFDAAMVVQLFGLQFGIARTVEQAMVGRRIQVKAQCVFGENATVVVQGVAVSRDGAACEYAVRLVVGAFLPQVQGVLAGNVATVHQCAVAADNQCAGAQFTAVVYLAVGNLQAACAEDFGILAVNQPRGVNAVVGAAKDLALVVDAAAVLEFVKAVGNQRAVVVELAALQPGALCLQVAVVVKGAQFAVQFGHLDVAVVAELFAGLQADAAGSADAAAVVQFAADGDVPGGTRAAAACRRAAGLGGKRGTGVIGAGGSVLVRRGGADNAVFLVVQLARPDGEDAAARLFDGARVVQFNGVNRQRAALQVATVVQPLRFEFQHVARKEAPVVIHHRAFDAQGFAAANGRARRVFKSGNAEAQVVTGVEDAVFVVQFLDVEAGDVSGGKEAAFVVEGGRLYGSGLAADFAFAVVQGLALVVEAFQRHLAAVGEGAGDVEIHPATLADASAVVDVAEGEAAVACAVVAARIGYCAAATGLFAGSSFVLCAVSIAVVRRTAADAVAHMAVVVPVGGPDLHAAAAGANDLSAVVQAVATQVERGRHQHAAVVHFAGRGVDVFAGAEVAAIVEFVATDARRLCLDAAAVVCLAVFDLQSTDVQLAAVVEVFCNLQVQLAATTDLSVVVQAFFEVDVPVLAAVFGGGFAACRVVAGLCLGVFRDVVAADAARVVEGFGTHLQGAAALADAAVVIEAVRVQFELVAVDAAAVGKFAVGTDLQLLRLYCTGVVDADALVGADQTDAAAVHAAQLAGVNGGVGAARTAAALAADFAVAGDVVAAGDDVQRTVACLYRAVNLARPGNDGGVVGVAHVQAAFADVHRAAFDVNAGEGTVLQLRAAGGQPGFAGVDEAAAVDADACRVGKDDVGLLAGDFDLAAQL